MYASKYFILRINLLFVLLFCVFNIYGQIYIVTGRVVNEKNNEPLAFVNIVANNGNTGTSTDIDGKFTLKNNKPVETLKISFIGYETKIINNLTKTDNLLIKLKQTVFQLSEVKIIAGENPAHRIIRNVLANKDINNPEKHNSFSYTTYNKMIFTSKIDSISGKMIQDSIRNEIDSFLKKQDFFIMESVTKKTFKYPDNKHEEVLASKASGFKNPFFVYIITQLQSFSFYNENFAIFDKFYVSPISKGCLSKYFFQITDTLYSIDNNDTTFIISYKPRQNSNFEGLTGQLSINTNKWAIENATASPAVLQKNILNINVQQKYEFIDNKQWFPTQLNTDLFVNIENFPYPFVVSARTYIKDIELNPNIKSKFGAVGIDINDNSSMQTDEYWILHRIDSLTKRDLTTYHVIDSLGQAKNFDKRFNAFLTLFNNKIPWGIIDFDIDKIIRYNEFEKFRLGVGIHTNDKLLKNFYFGGYFGYGFGDKQTKYGADFTAILDHSSDLKINLSYSNDLSEIGNSYFYKDKKSFFEGDFRDFFAKYFDYTQKYSIAFMFRTLKYLQTRFSLEKINKTPNFPYYFTLNKENYTLFTDNFNFTEFQIGLRYSYNEKYIKFKKQYLPLPKNNPIFWLNYTKGLKNVFEGEYDYQKLECKIEKSFYTNFIGKTTFRINGGISSNNLPYSLLFNSRAGYNSSYIDIPWTFNTIRYNEFASNQYFSLMFKHSFGTLLYRSKILNPEVVLLTNFIIGKVDNETNHQGIIIKAPERGYIESGICINNILKLNFSSLGIGAYYRYGYYSLQNTKDNFAIKWTMSITQ